MTLADDPAATHVTFLRGTPTTRNTPALDPALMYDIRDANLAVQALGAIQRIPRTRSSQPPWMFLNFLNGVIELTPQDKEDIKAFLELL